MKISFDITLIIVINFTFNVIEIHSLFNDNDNVIMTTSVISMRISQLLLFCFTDVFMKRIQIVV